LRGARILPDGYGDCREVPSSLTGRVLLLGAVSVCVILGCVHAASGEPGVALPHVTVIGDSVGDAIAFTPEARSLLAQGIDLELELAPCRRVGQASCPYNGVRPPTVIDLVQSLGSQLGATVVIAVGYNDFEAAYAGNIEDALAVLHAAGVTRVLWLTLRADRHSYLSMNDDIRAAAARHPEMTVVDWNLYSRSHPDWFQSDGLHLNGAGATAMATLLHQALSDLGIPTVTTPPPAPTHDALVIAPAKLANGRLDKRYQARLSARGGTKPYHWSLIGGALPRGLRLTSDGRIVGAPQVSGRFTITVKASDAHHSSATLRIRLHIRT
jgi:hypothetical protein